jgi:hypothetical protein
MFHGLAEIEFQIMEEEQNIFTLIFGLIIGAMYESYPE